MTIRCLCGLCARSLQVPDSFRDRPLSCPTCKTDIHTKTPVDETSCPFCREKVLVTASKCRHCGEILCPVLRQMTRPVRRSRMTAMILAFLLGGIGMHKFYLGHLLQGVLHLFFVWTFVPFILGIIDGVRLWRMPEPRFTRLYG